MRQISAGYSASVATFLAEPRGPLTAELALADARRFRTSEQTQLRAWDVTIAALQSALATLAEAQDWRIILEYPIRRLSRRIDALLITPRAILVLEFKVGAESFAKADQRQAEDYALDLQDFHAGCRHHPIVPILVATHARPTLGFHPLMLSGSATNVVDATAATLHQCLSDLWRNAPIPGQPLDVTAWEHAEYRPVPGIIDAACTLYSHHGVADIASARADAINLSATTGTILAAVAHAQAESLKIALFVTGIPGAGKTLCGLNTVFGAGRDSGATFLTGNPSLVHVLREALARDAANGERDRMRAARQRTKAAIQALPAFRDTYVAADTIPPEHVAVIDEAQRSWSVSHAIRKSADREVRLSDSEPGHLLDIMARHPDWAVLVCLIGNGQEIHDGEGGLAEWGQALATRPEWEVQASPTTLIAQDQRQRLPALAGFQVNPTLHLDVPMRSVRNAAAAPWVDAVLRDDATEARRISDQSGPIPFRVTRSLADMRAHLWHRARGLRRAGLVGSSGAKRLRADGLGAELQHMDAGAVARWFLDRWPEDVRASDALEQIATEFSCQGLELDHVGLCWGGDLIRANGWKARNFVGTKWQTTRSPESISNRVNTYRVLLTRARYETVIWVPMGDYTDRTRDPTELDAIARFLEHCGASKLAPSTPTATAPLPQAQPSLLYQPPQPLTAPPHPRDSAAPRPT